ncbi:GH36-type glycosyl hydrolase domain-containing protein [Tessaracoccus antarcticus]|uniref:GH36-type glycosyl hydrolase domain-containing protein n=1 Tax=Tessaracoccus antarcticus TaxID=2479848 RepID=UPI0013144D2A|nr:cellobiose phosphorylase [Tessaracoccus antarcticus]
MTTTEETPAPPIRARFSTAGALERLDAGDLSLLQYPGSELESGGHQVWLRRRSEKVGHTALGLLGPASGATVSVTHEGVVARGSLGDVEWCLGWQQPADGLFGWGLQVTNTGETVVELDAVCTLDAALTPWDALRRNEFYVSQYLDVSALGSGGGTMLAVRQNMPGDVTPWLALTCTRPVAGWCTDALQLASADKTGLDLTADLPSERLQHEHTLAGLQCEEISLAPGESDTVGFRVVVEADHPTASSDGDVELVRARLAAATWPVAPAALPEGTAVVSTLFGPVSWLHGEDLAADEFLTVTGAPANHVETGPDGRPWAYRAGDAHVVAGSKERAVVRPHGHILAAGEGPGPHDTASAVTVWMNGTVASQLTRGHADAAPLLSVRRSYLGITHAEGVRVFVDTGDGWRLLGIPSAWAATADSASWWWRSGGHTVVVRTTLTTGELRVDAHVKGGALPLLLAANTGDSGHDEGGLLFSDGRASAGGWLTRRSDDGPVCLRVPLLPGECPETDRTLVESIPRLEGPPASDALAEFLPWLAQDAVIHYQVPRGLEQFTGGAWGTRDVCQGPVGLLVAAGRADLVREVLTVVFAAQQDDGDWPQWFEYLPERRAPGHRESHGDVVYWPLLALGDYISMSGDTSILDERAGWVGEQDLMPGTPIREHVRAALDHISTHRAHDARLPAYGHGDWNDSLQPADPQVARWMCSTWTAELEIKVFSTLAEALQAEDRGLAGQLRTMAGDTQAALREHLLVDGELAGYAIMDEGGVELLVHPRDIRTGLTHGSLQMIHAIADELLTPEEARAHVAVINDHLDGPTGIYLFDTPVAYHGGETHVFLRAEAATFWGREIGLMYTHAHLRWVEALLRLGEADRAWRALQLVVPTGLGAAVPGATARQSNCYYSSVDAVFTDRVDAEARSSRMFDPKFGFEGGWRVYSSGPGLVLRLVSEGFLGLRWRAGDVVVDPVLPHSLHGLVATLVLGGTRVRVRYRVAGSGTRVRSVRINGVEVPTVGEPARYRAGGARIAASDWQDALSVVDHREVRMDVELG